MGFFILILIMFGLWVYYRPNLDYVRGDIVLWYNVRKTLFGRPYGREYKIIKL